MTNGSGSSGPGGQGGEGGEKKKKKGVQAVGIVRHKVQEPGRQTDPRSQQAIERFREKHTDVDPESRIVISSDEALAKERFGGKEGPRIGGPGEIESDRRNAAIRILEERIGDRETTFEEHERMQRIARGEEEFFQEQPLTTLDPDITVNQAESDLEKFGNLEPQEIQIARERGLSEEQIEEANRIRGEGVLKGAFTKRNILTTLSSAFGFKGFSKLTGIKGISNFLTKAGGTLIGASMIATWLATDNIQTGTNFSLNNIRRGVAEGIITPEEAAVQTIELEGINNQAEMFVKKNIDLNPILRLVGKPFLINSKKAEMDIELQKKLLGIQ